MKRFKILNMNQFIQCLSHLKMNIFNRPVLNQNQSGQLTYLKMGDLTIKTNWLKGIHNYHSYVLTAIHLGELQMEVEYLQRDRTQNNIFKLADINKEIINLTERSKMFEIKQNKQQFTTTGFWNSSYERTCIVELDSIRIESSKKDKPEAKISILDYQFYLETKKESQTKNLFDEKPLFVWLPDFPVRIFLRKEKSRSYCIYCTKIIKARQLLQYINLRKREVKMKNTQILTVNAVVNWKKKVTVLIVKRLSQYSKNISLQRKLLEGSDNLKILQEEKKTQKKQQPIFKKLSTNLDDQLPVLKLERNLSFKIPTRSINQAIHQKHLTGDQQLQPFSDLIKKRNSSLFQLQSPKKLAVVKYQINQQITQFEEQQKIVSNISVKNEIKHRQSIQLIDEQGYSETNSTFIKRNKQKIQEQPSQLYLNVKKNVYMMITQIETYKKSNYQELVLEVVQLAQNQQQTVSKSVIVVDSYQLKLIKAKQKYISQNDSNFKIAPNYSSFLFKLKIQGNQYSNQCEISPIVKYQTIDSILIYIKEVAFIGRCGFIISNSPIKRYQEHSTISFLVSYLKSQDYQFKYRFIQNGKAKIKVKNQFNKKIWASLITKSLSSNFQNQLEAQIFMGIPVSLKPKLFQLISNKQTYQAPSHGVSRIEKFSDHELKIIIQSFPEELSDELMNLTLLQNFIKKILKFQCNIELKQRIETVMLYYYLKYDSYKNFVYVLVHQIINKIKAVLINAKSEAELYRIIQIYYECEFEIDELFNSVYQYL